MRLWSLHPAGLDVKGLAACWREGLLARAVLNGQTKGYRNHPQLNRFKEQGDPIAALDTFLSAVCNEADTRGYRFDRRKLGTVRVPPGSMTVTEAQLAWEWQHLAAKLAVRDPARRHAMAGQTPRPHPLFRVVPGPVESWERV